MVIFLLLGYVLKIRYIYLRLNLAKNWLNRYNGQTINLNDNLIHEYDLRVGTENSISAPYFEEVTRHN